jgi:hypothetical protein
MEQYGWEDIRSEYFDNFITGWIAKRILQNKNNPEMKINVELPQEIFINPDKLMSKLMYDLMSMIEYFKKYGYELIPSITEPKINKEKIAEKFGMFNNVFKFPTFTLEKPMLIIIIKKIK